MIASRRRAHRRIHALLWPSLGLFLAFALGERSPDPERFDWASLLATEVLPASKPTQARNAPPIWSGEEAFGTWPARLSVYADGSIELTPLRPLDRPELLLYWVPPDEAGGRATETALPNGAVLLGRIFAAYAQRFALPSAARTTPRLDGSLVVFSLGHQEIVARASWPGEIAGRPFAEEVR